MAPASTIPKDPQNSARATGRRTPLQGIILTHNALTRGTPSPQHAGWLPRPVQHAPRASDPAARHHHRPGDLTARRHHRPGDRTPVAWRTRVGSCTRLRPSSGTLHDISQAPPQRGTSCSSTRSASAARRCSHPTPPCTPPAARTSHSGQSRCRRVGRRGAPRSTRCFSVTRSSATTDAMTV